jgi:hypothetical protein
MTLLVGVLLGLPRGWGPLALVVRGRLVARDTFARRRLLAALVTVPEAHLAMGESGSNLHDRGAGHAAWRLPRRAASVRAAAGEPRAASPTRHQQPHPDPAAREQAFQAMVALAYERGKAINMALLLELDAGHRPTRDARVDPARLALRAGGDEGRRVDTCDGARARGCRRGPWGSTLVPLPLSTTLPLSRVGRSLCAFGRPAIVIVRA